MGLLVLDHPQLRHSAVAVVAQGANEYRRAVLSCAFGKYWDVGRAVRHCDHQPGARFRSIKLEALCADGVGLGHANRQHRIVPNVAASVHSLFANDVDIGSPRTDRATERGQTMSRETSIPVLEPD